MKNYFFFTKLTKIMDFTTTIHNLERLEEQVLFYNPTLKSAEQRQNVRDCLRKQLIESEAVVRIQRMDAECESLMISLKQRLMLLQDILMPKDNKNRELQVAQQHQDLEYHEEVTKLNLSSDSSDDETLSSIMAKQRQAETQKINLAKKGKMKSIETQLADTSEPDDTYLPLALRRKPRERKLSYKSLSSSASTSHSHSKRTTKLHNKHEHTVTTSGVAFHSEEMLLEEEEVDTTPTLHIKIPSLHRGNVHYIILDSLKQKASITHSSKTTTTKSSRKKQVVKSLPTTVVEQLTQQEQDLELSQLIQDVMAEACNEETLQATNALENINNNIIDNYEPIANDNFVNYSQSSQELTFSQNSNLIVDTVCSTSGTSSSQKKQQRKNSKRSGGEQQQQHLYDEPPKKRGRRPKKKNAFDEQQQQLQPQPPTKSNLAKYVEFFANDCELMPGSTTPAASSTRSQPLVSSTTHNFEVIDQLGQQQQQQNEQQTSPHQQQPPITYYIDGDWANGGPCQLIATNNMSVDTRQLNQEDMNAPFQDFVNYIDNSSDSGNNVIARVLENSNSLPISIPLPIANLGLQNKNLTQVASRQIQQTVQTSFVPVINIQIPNLPNNIISATAPPPAHTHKDVLDLSMKPKSNANIISNEVLNLSEVSNNNLGNSYSAEEDNCLPLDLSAKSTNAKKQQVIETTNHVTIDKQDEDFIRRLIEQNEFEYSTETIKKGSENTLPALSYDHDNNKSFKAALDMPLLDFDATDLAELVENTTTGSNKEAENLTDKINYNNSTNNEDSNYVSMSAVNSSLENNLHFSDQSTTEIFNKLLDICPDNQFLENISNEFISTDELNESVFDQCRVENSTMCDNANLTNEKQKNICDTTSEQDIHDKGNSSSIDEPSSSTSTSLAVQIDSSNKTSSDLNISMSSDMSDNLKFSDNDDQEDLIKDAKKSLDLNKTEIKEIGIDPEKNGLKTLKNKTTEKCSGNSQNNNLNKDENFETIEQIKGNNKDQQCSSINLEKAHNIETDKMDEEKCLTQTQGNNEKMQNKAAGYNDNLKSEQQNVIEVANTKIVANKNTNNNKDANENKYSSDNNKTVLDSSYDNKNKSKPEKENIVFSVAKITLSEDDILYSTDSSSDTASGKSCDVSDVKPMDIENEIKEPQKITSKEGNKVNFTQNIEAAKDLSKATINQEKENYYENPKDAATNEMKNCPSYSNDIINLSVSVENNNDKKKTIMDADTEMKDLTPKDIEKKTIDKEPKYTDNDNEHSNDSIISCYYNDDSVLLLNETENNESLYNEVLNLSMEPVLNIHNAEDEDDDLQCRAKNDADMEKEALDKSQQKEDNNVKLVDINQHNLTLLELESKLEGSLDFDEDLDDALSLATSCFDSPNDDRFEDSVVNEDDTATTSTPTKPLAQEIQNNDRTNLSPPPPPLPNKDIKHFKIPKLKITTVISTKIPENELDTKQNTTTEPTTITNPLPKPQLTINLEKITRTVKNNLIHSNDNCNEIILTTQNEQTSTIVEIISKVFGITCLPYLVDKCLAITYCQLSHQFNDSDTVYQHLNTLDKLAVNLAYRVLYNHSKLFIIYFKVFCAYYSNKNDRSKLLNMVNDCERYPEYGEFLIDIYESLVKCGFSRVNACRQILKRIREFTTATTIVEVLVTIIMKSDWTMFTDFVEKYTQEMYKFNFRIGILEQMAPAVLNSKGSHLKQVFGKCVQTLHCDDTALLLNSPSLIQCVALLTTTSIATNTTTPT